MFKMNKQNKPTHRYKKMVTDRRLDGGGMGKKVKGIKRYKLVSHGDAKYNIGNINNITVILYGDRWTVDFSW